MMWISGQQAKNVYYFFAGIVTQPAHQSLNLGIQRGQRRPANDTSEAAVATRSRLRPIERQAMII